jgi:hypothetical protein
LIKDNFHALVQMLCLKAAAKLDIGLQENEKICKAIKKIGKKDKVPMSEESLKRLHARKALSTNWLAQLKNRNRATKS